MSELKKIVQGINDQTFLILKTIHELNDLIRDAQRNNNDKEAMTYLYCTRIFFMVHVWHVELLLPHLDLIDGMTEAKKSSIYENYQQGKTRLKELEINRDTVINFREFNEYWQ